MIFKLGELFSGPGGLALGAGLATNFSNAFEDYSIEHIWGVDKDSSAIASYNENIVRKYGGSGICIDAIEFCNYEINEYEKINALAFGFPCNDFSLLGEKKGFQGKYGNLYKAGIIAISKTDPFWFIAENVSGIYSANSGKAFRKILNELRNAGKYGYKLNIHLYKFEEYGVPQYRHRYIIVGIRKDLEIEFKVPAPTHRNGKFVTAEKAISNISAKAYNMKLTKQNERVVMRLKYTPPWNNAWFLDDLLEMTPSIRRRVLETIPWYEEEIQDLSDYRIKKEIEYSKLNCKKAKMSHIYKRLDSSRPSYTITGSGGGGTHVYHWKEKRALTNRERAKLQSFPDWFEFKGSKEQIRKQIGMAVPPKASKKIFESILKSFAGIQYKSVDANYSE